MNKYSRRKPIANGDLYKTKQFNSKKLIYDKIPTNFIIGLAIFNQFNDGSNFLKLIKKFPSISFAK